MEKRIKFFSAITIFMIIVATITALFVTDAKDLASVKNVKMVHNSENSISLTWKEVKKADGYYIYNLDSDTNKYVKIGTSKGENNCKYDIKDIPSASIYKVKVLAYRSFMKKEYLSGKAKEYTFYSNPSKPILSVFSGGKGVLSMEWNDLDNLAGYDIQYSKNKEFTEYKNEMIKDGQTRNFSVNDLAVGEIYYARVRAYMTVNRKTIYSEWSDVGEATIYDKDINIGKVDPTKPMIAFSFDDGPAYDYKNSNSTERILDVLEKYNARATFFMVGERVNSETKHLLDREIQNGCELGNHSYAHPNMKELSTDDGLAQFQMTDDLIAQYNNGQGATVIRFPYGNSTDELLASIGRPSIMWDVDTLDWQTKNVQANISAVLDSVSPGDIILMHDIHETTVESCATIVPELINRGYELVTIHTLAAANGVDLAAGETYYGFHGGTTNE